MFFALEEYKNDYDSANKSWKWISREKTVYINLGQVVTIEMIHTPELLLTQVMFSNDETTIGVPKDTETFSKMLQKLQEINKGKLFIF
jgi:hypothetical protein